MRRFPQVTLWVVCTSGWLGWVAGAASLSDLVAPPTVPEERLTVEQKNLLKVARSTQGDSFEERQLQACIDLSADAAVPEELRRWAELRRIPLLCFTGGEWDAVGVARDWLKSHPDDEMAVKVRSVVTSIMTGRGHKGFQPSFEDKERAFLDLFEHHDSHELEVIEGHIAFCHVLTAAPATPARDHQALQRDALEHLELAEAGARELIEMPTPYDFESRVDRVRWLEKHDLETELCRSMIDDITAARQSLLHPELDPQVWTQLRESHDRFPQQGLQPE